MSTNSKENFAGIKDALTKREELIRVVLLAALLALGINLLASFLFLTFADQYYSTLVVGVILILVVLSYLFTVTLRARCASYRFECVVPIVRNKVGVKVIPGYKLTEDLHRTLDAVFLENTALKSAWESEPLVEPVSPDVFEPFLQNKNEKIGEGKNIQSTRDSTTPTYVAVAKMNVPDRQSRSRSAAIMRESLEFVILKQLSYHLSEYFQEFYDQDSQIMEYNRKDVPELLLENRIVSLLTTPLEDRAVFAKADIQIPKEGEVYSVYGSDGSMYTRFNLVLPKGSKVKRPSLGVLELENDRVALTLEIDYKGTQANLPRNFEMAFLGVPTNSIQPLKVDLLLTTKIRTLALFRRSGWKYHHWIDSFAKRLEEYTQFSRFLRKVNWESTITHFRIKDNIARLKKEQSTR